ncbi:MAG TPA: AsnC family transcriptional regulator [Candidatus Thermoplasmatota archaeon]|nr:AsnC family transcriptional regulator [Candidatus Thermoplasmatota archaeon]
MDELDLRILGCLPWKPGDPIHMARGILRPWDIARTLGVHGNTVKFRLQAMRDAGVLKGLYLMPMPLLREHRVAVYWLRFDDVTAKAPGLAALRRRRDVTDTTEYVGQEARVGILSEPGEDLRQVAERIRAASRASAAELFYERTSRLGPLRISPLDRRILAALLPDALRPFSEVADEVGVTQRTVRLRFRALAEARAFSIIPQLDLGPVEGLLAFELAVAFDRADPATHAAFLQAFPEAFYRSRPELAAGYVYLGVRSPAQMEDAVLKARALPGVREARARLMRGYEANIEVAAELLAEAGKP